MTNITIVCDKCGSAKTERFESIGDFQHWLKSDQMLIRAGAYDICHPCLSKLSHLRYVAECDAMERFFSN